MHRALPLLFVTFATACGGGSGGGGTTPFPFPAAIQVIGQPGFVTRDLDHGQPMPNASGLANPSGVVVNGAFLLVVDAANNRVLGFSGPPATDGPMADFVVGQPDLTSFLPGLAADRLDRPRAACLHGAGLIVADTANHRVLIWDAVPTMGEPADVVLGQTAFDTNVAAAGASGMNEPSDVFVVGGRLLVADAQNHRVLIWNALPTTNGAPADLVLGQASPATSAPATTATGLNAPAGVWSDGTRILVSDGGNHRLMIWNSFPAAHGATADAVVGQPDFTTAVPGIAQERMNSPRGVTSDGTRLFVADASNHRVLVYATVPTTTGTLPASVLGQAAFTNNQPNDDNQDGSPEATPSARTLNFPNRPLWANGRLYVAEFFNHRVVVFTP